MCSVPTKVKATHQVCICDGTGQLPLLCGSSSRSLHKVPDEVDVGHDGLGRLRNLHAHLAVGQVVSGTECYEAV